MKNNNKMISLFNKYNKEIKQAHKENRILADRKPISRDTIARMASFKRHQQYKDVPYSEGCGGLMYDAWGGTSGIEWAINKLKQIDKNK